MINQLSRRSFLQVIVGTGASLAIGSFGSIACASAALHEDVNSTAAAFVPNAFVKIDPDGTCTVTITRSDMGQGIRTTFAMLVAEELDMDWTKVKVVQAPGDSNKYGRQGTGGSSSTRGMNGQLRQLGATARAMLVSAAAAQWGVEATACRTEMGKVIGPDGKSIGYGQLTEAAQAIPAPQNVKLKDKANFKIIGKRTNRVDNTDVVTGKPVFSGDIRVEGMIYAVMARPPAFGASPANVDDKATRAVTGVLDVIRAGSNVCVIATNTWAAIKGRDALVITWNNPNAAVSTASLRSGLKKSAVAHMDMPGGKTIEASIELPYLAHATMETFNAVADVRADSVEVWTGSQSPDGAQSQIARMTGVSQDKVTVHTTLLGGGFGRKFSNEWVGEAVDLSKRLQKPVKLLWTRECDIQHDTYRPMSEHVMKAAVDTSGNPVGWSHQYLQAPGRSGGDYSDGTYLPYDFPNAGMLSGGVSSPVPTGPWRSVEHSQIVVANECFVDELAAAAGMDPYEFRRKHIKSDRLRKVLESAATKSGWGKPVPAGHGRGIACFDGYGSCIAHVVEVAVNGTEIKVVNMWAVVDVGTAINPSGVEAQVQGAFMDAVSTSLYAGITIDKGGTEQTNYDGYEWARCSDAPQMHVFVEDSGGGFGGMGEVGYPSAPAAIANAIANATRKRARKFPIKVGELV